MGVIAAVAALLCVWDLSSCVVWDGSLPLHLRLVGSPKQPIKGVAYHLLIRKESAEEWLNPKFSDLYYVDSPWSDEPLATVMVSCSGRATRFSPNLSYS